MIDPHSELWVLDKNVNVCAERRSTLGGLSLLFICPSRFKCLQLAGGKGAENNNIAVAVGVTSWGVLAAGLTR